MSAAKGNAYADLYNFRSIPIGTTRDYPIRGQQDAGRIRSALCHWGNAHARRTGEMRPLFTTKQAVDGSALVLRVTRYA